MEMCHGPPLCVEETLPEEAALGGGGGGGTR